MRRSGRTLKSMLYAHQMAASGKTVIFVCATNRLAAHTLRKFAETFQCTPEIHNAASVGSGTVLFRGFDMNCRGGQAEVVFDHSVLYGRYIGAGVRVQLQLWDEVQRREDEKDKMA